jgi:RNA polymerase sigma-70 factor, ECF subfamily
MEELIRRARQGERAALEALLERVRPRLRELADRRLDRRLGARLDASDVVQDTLMDVARALSDFRGSTEEELVAWLRQVLSNNVRDAHRRHGRAAQRAVGRQQALDAENSRGQAVGDFLSSGEPTPSQGASATEQQARLIAAMQGLPEEHREVVRLRYFERLQLAELAARLGCNTMAAAKRLERAVKALRRRMGEDAAT